MRAIELATHQGDRSLRLFSGEKGWTITHTLGEEEKSKDIHDTYADALKVYKLMIEDLMPSITYKPNKGK